MDVLYAFIFLIVGFGLNEFSHRARRIQDAETITNLLNMTYLRLGYKPEKKEIVATPSNSTPIAPNDTTTKDARAELEPPSIDNIRNEAYRREMLK